jgi:hypothetical protein
MSDIYDVITKWYHHGNPRMILDLSNWNIDELPDMPDSVEKLNICWTNIKHLKGLPKNLKWLRACRSDIETIELPLPPNLEYLDLRRCKHLKRFEVPKNITFLSDIDRYERKRKYEQERFTEDHYVVAKRRVQEWIEENKNKKQKTDLYLARLQIKELPEGIPDEIEQMNCGGNFALTSLKGLPKGLKRLKYTGYPLKEFNDLPDGLEYLEANGSKIEILDNIPNSVKKIDITYYSKLRIIKSLPSELKELNLSQATDLEEIQCDFPLKLRVLNMDLTYIEKIPTLPDSLTKFDISINCKIQELPNLPQNLKVLFIDRIQFLPPLPDGLLWLDISDICILNNNSLPNSIRRFNSSELQLEDPLFRLH